MWAEERRERAEKIKQADKITPIKESEKPETFFSRFEEVMHLAEIEEGEWTIRLAPLFVGRHADINHDHVAKEMKIDYFSFKAAFVTTAGSPLLIDRREYMSYQKKFETPGEVVRKVETLVQRMTRNSTSIVDCCRDFVFAKVSQCICPAVSEHVELRRPATGQELTTIIQIYVEGRQHWCNKRMARMGQNGTPCFYQVRRNDGRKDENREHSEFGKNSNADQKQSSGTKYRQDFRSDKAQGNGGHQPRVVQCWTCKKDGHVSSDCPESSGGSRHSKLGWPDPRLFLNCCCSLLLLELTENKHCNRNIKETKGVNLRMAKKQLIL